METMEIEKRFQKNPDKGKEKIDSQSLVPFLFPSGSSEGGLILKTSDLEVPFDPRTFGEQLQHGMKDLFFNNHLSDVTVIVGRDADRIPAHKFVLYAWSPKFQTQLKELGEEARELLVEVEGDDAQLFKMMLQYMYTGTSDQKINERNVMPLLRLCHEYGVDPLKEECGDFLFTNSEQINVAYLLDVADKYAIKKLEKRCAEYLAENFADIVENDDSMLMQLKTSTWVELVKSDEVKVTREEEIFNAVLKFADVNGKTSTETREILNQLLPHIRFTLCSPKFLVEEVETNPDLMQVPVLKSLLFETFRYKANPKTSFLFTPLNTKRRKANLNVMLQWDKDQAFTHGVYNLENDELTAHKSSMPGTIYILRTKTKLEGGGSFYWEIQVDQTAGNQELHLGIAEEHYNFHTAYLRANGTHYIERTGAVMQGHSQVVQGPTLNDHDNVGFALNLDDGTFQIYHNGASVHTFTGVKGPVWPCVAARDVGTKLTLVGKKPKIYHFPSLPK
jgi:hypothetical protein